MENGIEDGRNQAIADAALTAKRDYDIFADPYETQHNHVFDLVTRALGQKEGDQWEFNINQNINAVFVSNVGRAYEFSEFEVGHPDGTVEIVNAYIGQEKEIAARTPEDDQAVSGDNLRGTENMLNGIRDPSNTVYIPAHDTELVEHRDGNKEGSYDQLRVLAGMLVREGGIGAQPQNKDIAFIPSNLLIADTNKEVDEVYETKYEQGDTALVDEISRLYLDNFEDTDTAVRYSITEIGEGANEPEEDRVHSTAEDGQYRVEMWTDPDFNINQEIADA